MIDKLIEAIGEIVGGDGTEQTDPSQEQKPAAKAGFVPDGDQTENASHDGQVGRRLDQLVSDAKKQVGDKPQ